MSVQTKTSQQNVKHSDAVCYHCGDYCRQDTTEGDGKVFCCSGCYSVYQIVKENNLCTYYESESKPGVALKQSVNLKKYEFLEEEKVQQAYIRFKNDKETHIRFYLPSIHCQSCVWLLEKLHRIDNGVLSSRVDFDKKEISIIYDPRVTNLRKVVSVMASVGYEPHLSLNDLDKPAMLPSAAYKARLYKLGVAGFCFGNIMLFSFPEYLGMSGSDAFTRFFPWINFALALPVFFYSASEFSLPALKAVRHGFVSVDIPVFLAILATFVRSSTDVIAGWGPGFFDSMSGIVFFMLAGRVFQDKSYNGISFHRNYKSYLPVSVASIRNGVEQYIPVSEIVPGDVLVIRHNEIIPVDGRVLSGQPHMDYSFVTGESELVKVNTGDIIYAGGKHVGAAIQLMAEKKVSQSYLTSLWNNPKLNREDRAELSESFIHKLAVNFTWLVLVIAMGSFLYWITADVLRAFNAFTSVLIIACPCALLLSSSFTYGNMTRIFARNGMYLRNPVVIEKMAATRHIVLDKTGTLTSGKDKTVTYKGKELSPYEKTLVASVLYHSQHPNSRVVSQHLVSQSRMEISDYTEVAGKGIQAILNGHVIKVGSGQWCLAPGHVQPVRAVHVNIDNAWYGYFEIESTYRPNLQSTITALTKKWKISLISGDNNHDEPYLQGVFPKGTPMHFNFSPEDKMNYIEKLMHEETVAMVGDGLNDVSAFKQSNVGIAVSEDANNFTPSCDAVLESKSFFKLPALFEFSRKARPIILGSFIISLLYNSLGLVFAVQGTFSPLLAAILMPVSTLSIIAYTTLGGNYQARFLKLD